MGVGWLHCHQYRPHHSFWNCWRRHWFVSGTSYTGSQSVTRSGVNHIADARGDANAVFIFRAASTLTDHVDSGRLVGRWNYQPSGNWHKHCVAAHRDLRSPRSRNGNHEEPSPIRLGGNVAKEGVPKPENSASLTFPLYGRLAQLARASPLQGEGRGFESLNAHHSR